MPKIIGIDLGTTNSVAAINKNKYFKNAKIPLFKEIFNNLKKQMEVKTPTLGKVLGGYTLAFRCLLNQMLNHLNAVCLKNPLFRPILSIKP